MSHHFLATVIIIAHIHIYYICMWAIIIRLEKFNQFWKNKIIPSLLPFHILLCMIYLKALTESMLGYFSSHTYDEWKNNKLLTRTRILPTIYLFILLFHCYCTSLYNITVLFFTCNFRPDFVTHTHCLLTYHALATSHRMRVMNTFAADNFFIFLKLEAGYNKLNL